MLQTLACTRLHNLHNILKGPLFLKINQVCDTVRNDVTKLKRIATKHNYTGLGNVPTWSRQPINDA